MGRDLKLKPVFDHSRRKWMLSLPPALSPTGKRRRLFFDTEDEAKTHASGLKDGSKQLGKMVKGITPELMKTAVQYEELAILSGFDGLRDFCRQQFEKLEASAGSPTLATVLDSFHADRSKNWSDIYKTDRWKPFRARLLDLEETRISVLDHEAWKTWLSKWAAETSPAPTTFNQQLGMLRAVFNVGIARKVHPVNPLEGITPSKDTSGGETAVFTPAEARRLLETAWEHDRDMVPWFAVAIFTGIRPDSELTRCRFEHFDWKAGHLKVLESKTGNKRRFVEISDAIRAWLEPWVLKKGPVKVPTNHRRRYEQIVRGYYTTPGAKFRDRSTWVALVPWDNDITRHTYGSYFEAENRSEAGCRERLAANMGHTTYKTFNTHYRNGRTAEEAAQFWGLRPPGYRDSNIVRIA